MSFPVSSTVDAANMNFPPHESIPHSDSAHHCQLCSQVYLSAAAFADHITQQHNLTMTAYRARALCSAKAASLRPVPPQLLRERVSAFAKTCAQELLRDVCAACVRRLPQHKLLPVFFPKPGAAKAPSWLEWPHDAWATHQQIWWEKMNDLLCIDSYLRTYFQTEKRILAAQHAQTQASGEDVRRADIWLQRVRNWARMLQLDLESDSVLSPLGSHWLLHPHFTRQEPTGLSCQLCNKCRCGFKAFNATSSKPQPYLSVVARARGLWGGPEPSPLADLTWMGRRILQLGRAVICVRHSTKVGAAAPGVPYTQGNVLLFPQRASEITRCIGLLPQDLTCDIALQTPTGAPTAFNADAELHVSLPALRKALHWFLTHNFEWMLATKDDGDPERNYLGAHLEDLLRQYADSLATGPIPQELLATATRESHPSSMPDQAVAGDAVAVDGGEDSDSPLALWLAALRKYDVLHEAEKALQQQRRQQPNSDTLLLESERLAALRDAIAALAALNSTETRAKLAAFEHARQSQVLTLQLPAESTLLDMFSPSLWSHCFSDLFYRADCWEHHPAHKTNPGKGRSPLDHSRRWIRTLFQRADFTGWATSKEFAAVAANIFLRRDQLAAIQSWTRGDGGALRIQQTLADLSAEDFIQAMAVHGGDFPTLQAAISRTHNNSHSLHRLFTEMQLVLRHVDGSEAQRCQGVHRMRALRTWCGCSVLFLTINPTDKSPLMLAYTHSRTGKHIKLPLDPSYEALHALYRHQAATDSTAIRSLARTDSLAAMHAVRFIIERVLDVLLNCAKASRKPSSNLCPDLVASRTGPGVFGHVSAYYTVIETTQNLREHAHMLIHLLGFQHPEDLFDHADFHQTFSNAWQYFASISFASPEAFARYVGGTTALQALHTAPVLPVTPKQCELLGPNLATEILARQRRARLPTTPQTPPPDHERPTIHPDAIPWPHSVHTDCDNYDAWAATSALLANQAAIAFGNHVCLPATCHKRGKKYCRMLYWHWSQRAQKNNATKLHRTPGLPLAEAWPALGLPPLIQAKPHAGLPALERHHPFHYKMTPSLVLGCHINHDLGLLFRFPDPAQHLSKQESIDQMIDAISTHEYYCAGYLQKGSDPCQGLLHTLHDAKTQCDRALVQEADKIPQAITDATRNAHRLFCRMIFSMNKRHRFGFPSIYAYLVGKPSYYCSHDFVLLPLYLHMRTAVSSVTSGSARTTPLSTEATLPDTSVPRSPPPASTAPTYLPYDYPWRPRTLEAMNFYFFAASTTVVTTLPAEGWLWPLLLDAAGVATYHPAIIRRSADPRFMAFSASCRQRHLLDPRTNQPFSKCDHYRLLHLDKPWRLPQILGAPTQKPAADASAQEKGEYALAAMLLFRPWRHTGAAVRAWTDPHLPSDRVPTPAETWQALHTSFLAWRHSLRQTWAVIRTAPPQPGTTEWWEYFTYEKLRNYELTKAHVDHTVFKRPQNAEPSPRDPGTDSESNTASTTSTSSSPVHDEYFDEDTPMFTTEAPHPDASTPDTAVPCGDLAGATRSHWTFGMAAACNLSGQNKTFFDQLHSVLELHQLAPTSFTLSPSTPNPSPTYANLNLRQAISSQQKFFKDLDTASTTDPEPVSPAPSSDSILPPFQQSVQNLLLKWSALGARHARPNTCVLEAVHWLLDAGVFSNSCQTTSPNLKQSRGLILAALWLQSYISKQSPLARPAPSVTLNLPNNFAHILLVTGGAGSGKSTLLLVVDQLFQHFAGDCLHKAAPTITAARLIRGDTIHALHKLPRTTLTSKSARMTTARLTAHRRRWRGKIGHCIDEVSMTSPKQLHQMDVRCQAASKSPLTFGGLWTCLSGDFLQLPPIGMPSLADVATAPDTESALGQSLWQSIQTHVQLNANMRSSGPLADLLDQMRAGNITDAMWELLCSRQLQRTASGRSDPRLQQRPFATSLHCIVSRHSIRAAVAYAQTLQSSITSNDLFFVLQANDQISTRLDDVTLRAAQQHLLTVSNARNTGSLPGILPLHHGCRVRLTGGKSCLQLGIMKGALCEIVSLHCHPQDVPTSGIVGDVNVLRYIPPSMCLRLVGATWTLPQACLADFPRLRSYEGVFLLEPETESFSYKYQSQDLQVRRTSYPLQPAAAAISYGAQGESFPCTLLDLAPPPRTDPKKHWLAIYVMLSRAPNLESILLLRNAPRTAFTCGPPDYLLTELQRLERLEHDTTRHARKILLTAPPPGPSLAEYFDERLPNRLLVRTPCTHATPSSASAGSGPTPPTHSMPSQQHDASTHTRSLPPSFPSEPPLKRCRFKQPDPTRLPMAPGLLNEENTCYLNALLFALHTSKHVRLWVATHMLTCSRVRCPVPDLLADFHRLQRPQQAPFLPSLAVSRALWCPDLAGRRHHDVTETFSHLLAAAESCENTAYPHLNPRQLHDNLQLPIWQCFGACKLQTISCTNCSETSVSQHLHSFTHVHPAHPLFHDCAHGPEPLEHSSCSQCRQSNCKHLALEMQSWPKTLVLCLNRWSPNSTPSPTPLFPDTLPAPSGPLSYKFRAAVFHQGTQQQGHYTTVLRSPFGLCLRNDAHPQQLVDTKLLCSPDIYMLIYDLPT